MYYDSIYMKSVLQNNGAQNISVFGPGQNPAGSDQVAQAAGNCGCGGTGSAACSRR